MVVGVVLLVGLTVVVVVAVALARRGHDVVGAAAAVGVLGRGHDGLGADLGARDQSAHLKAVDNVEYQDEK